MRNKRKGKAWMRALASSAIVIVASYRGASAQSAKCLYSFDNVGNSGISTNAVVFDSEGNLYGAAALAGELGAGTVFKLTPQPGPSWKETVLWNFSNLGPGGSQPNAVVLDRFGNLFGTTSYGGAHGNGLVFELSRVAGQWAEKVLHTFDPGLGDGSRPVASLTMDSAGNLYGVTAYGGALNRGRTYKLTRKASGEWDEEVLHDFANNGEDGYEPYIPLLFDASGNLYGATALGGTFGYGTVFELQPQPDGTWLETILHEFSGGGDGIGPVGLIFDSFGDLYGVADEGGTSDVGVVFELVPSTGGPWTETILHNFSGGLSDGSYPSAGLVFDASGNLFGTTRNGGDYADAGTVFELTPSGGGWTERLPYIFKNTRVGQFPNSTLVFDQYGSLYGTTALGGVFFSGTVFKVTP
jgi:uncharacterized repeat protein (TIGR03803 family)